MKILIDDKACKKNNITLAEFMILFLIANNENIDELIQSITKKQLIDKDLFNKGKYVVGSKSIKLLNSVMLDSNKLVQSNEERIKNLAEKLREIYIPGKKLGTQDYFKSSSNDVQQKLKRFFVDYGDFTDEQIINATKKYVASFNGDYKFAQLLKYFISKQVDGERGSRLLSYIENEKEEDPNQTSIDWGTELV